MLGLVTERLLVVYSAHSEAELRDLFDVVDADASGEIDWDEFLTMISSQVSRDRHDVSESTSDQTILDQTNIHRVAGICICDFLCHHFGVPAVGALLTMTRWRFLAPLPYPSLFSTSFRVVHVPLLHDARRRRGQKQNLDHNLIYHTPISNRPPWISQ